MRTAERTAFRVKSSSDSVTVIGIGTKRSSAWTYSSGETQSDAARVAENLSTPFQVIPIKPAQEAYGRMLAEAFAGREPNIAEENLQARARGNTLMALSNKFGWLVLTTGNKSEVSVGYSTLYGDSAGGFAVIKDVPKLLVYQLCEYRNQADAPAPGPIPETIVSWVSAL